MFANTRAGVDGGDIREDLNDIAVYNARHNGFLIMCFPSLVNIFNNDKKIIIEIGREDRKERNKNILFTLFSMLRKKIMLVELLSQRERVFRILFGHVDRISVNLFSH